MTLHKKTLSVVAVAFACFTVLLYAFLQYFVLAEFDRLETQAADRRLDLATDNLSREIEQLGSLAADWAGWDEAYEYMENRGEEFVRSNLSDSSFIRLKLNFILYVDLSGDLAAGKGFHLGEQREVPVPENLVEHLTPVRLLARHHNMESGVTGVLLIPEGPLLIASRPVLTSREEGPSRGTLVMGRFLDAVQIQRLAALTHLSLSIYPWGKDGIPPEALPLYEALSETSPRFIRPLNRDTLQGCALFPDVYGRPGLFLKVDMPRALHHEGHVAVRYAIFSLTGMLLVFGGILFFILEKMVLAPVAALDAGVTRIGPGGDSSGRLPLPGGKDELASLAVSINRMVERLETSRHELAESEERYRAVMEQSSEGIVLCDTITKAILEANDSFLKLVGFTREDLPSLSLYDLASSPREKLDEDLDQAVHKKLFSLGERSFVRKDGSLADVEVNSYRIFFGGREALCLVARDIGERKRVQGELKRAKEAAEAASNAKSDFLAGVSHEIRTPMNVIVGMTDLLSGTPLTSEQQEYVHACQSSGAALLNLINGILDLSRVESGRIELESVRFDPAEVVEKTRTLMKARARLKGIEIASFLNPDVPQSLVGDPGRLHQVLLNLVGNAVKFTEKGHIRIDVRRKGADGIGMPVGMECIELEFTVTDTGVGIPPEKLVTVFEAFTQADASITRQYGGTGLGLTISKKLVELMGGTICVESEPGRGSVFHFTGSFTIPPREEDSTRPEATVSPARELPACRILLADDSPDNRLLYRAYFKKSPVKLDIVVNGLEAVEKFQSNQYDVVLMDMHMPIMDGYTATAAIRDWERSRGVAPTPVIALTAHALEERLKKTLEAGCTAYVIKPATRAVLVAAIVEALAPGTGQLYEGAVVYADPELAPLIPGYLRDRREDSRTILDALDRDDFGLIRTLGHNMKGSGGGYGMEAVGEIGRGLEAAALENDPAEIRKLIEKLLLFVDTCIIVPE